MDISTAKLALAAAGGAASVDPVYVDDVFSTFLYEGNNSTNTITNGIDFAGEGGMLWVKARNNSSAEYHTIVDTERPIKSNQSGYPYLNSASSNSELQSGLTSFNSDGFTWGFGNNQYNGSLDYVSWSFRKAPGFFDVVTFTAGVQDADERVQIPHSLGSVPGVIILKRTDGVSSWNVYHKDAGYDNPSRWNIGLLEDTNSFTAYSGIAPIDYQTASYFTTEGLTEGREYVAYIFAHDDAQFGTNEDESIIKCGSFSSTGFVDLGWEPQWVIMKSVSETNAYRGDWRIFDNMRGIFDGDDAQLFANDNRAEDKASFAQAIKLNATGFTVEGQGNYGTSTVYMAIRRPNKPPEVATEVFNVSYRITGEPTYPAPFVVDAAIMATRNGTGAGADSTYHGWFSRLTGQYGLPSTTTNGEYNWGSNSGRFDHMDGWGGSDSASTFSHSYMFKRAPGFMDVVAYEGTGSARTLDHNLTVTPELMLVKKRSAADSWNVYHSSQGPTKFFKLDNPYPIDTSTARWNDTAPTNSVFTVGTDGGVNANGHRYVAYLFATLPGISKVGSYSGTGYDVNVDCGFTAGARFVMIKRADGNSDWYVFDTLRGITTGNDPYIFMNSYILQVTNTDYIDPLSTGFTITSSAPTDLNTNGGTYTFLAIA